MLIALADLVEAEGRQLRVQAGRLGRSLALVVVSVLLAGAGAGLLLWALYQALAQTLGSAGGALATGLAALLGAGVVAWVAKLSVR